MQGGEGVMQAKRKSQEIKADQVPPESQTFLAPSGLIHTPKRTHSETVIICNSERQGVSAEDFGIPSDAFCGCGIFNNLL